MVEKKTYNEYSGYKVGDIIFYLDHYTIREATILEIFDDYYDDDENYICKWVKHTGGCDHFSDVFNERYFAENRIQSKKILMIDM
jgi:hypothetical protein